MTADMPSSYGQAVVIEEFDYLIKGNRS